MNEEDLEVKVPEWIKVLENLIREKIKYTDEIPKS